MRKVPGMLLCALDVDRPYLGRPMPRQLIHVLTFLDWLLGTLFLAHFAEINLVCGVYHKAWFHSLSMNGTFLCGPSFIGVHDDMMC